MQGAGGGVVVDGAAVVVGSWHAAAEVKLRQVCTTSEEASSAVARHEQTLLQNCSNAYLIDSSNGCIEQPRQMRVQALHSRNESFNCTSQQTRGPQRRQSRDSESSDCEYDMCRCAAAAYSRRRWIARIPVSKQRLCLFFGSVVLFGRQSDVDSRIINTYEAGIISDCHCR